MHLLRGILQVIDGIGMHCYNQRKHGGQGDYPGEFLFPVPMNFQGECI